MGNGKRGTTSNAHPSDLSEKSKVIEIEMVAAKLMIDCLHVLSLPFKSALCAMLVLLLFRSEA